MPCASFYWLFITTTIVGYGHTGFGPTVSHLARRTAPSSEHFGRQFASGSEKAPTQNAWLQHSSASHDARREVRLPGSVETLLVRSRSATRVGALRETLQRIGSTDCSGQKESGLVLGCRRAREMGQWGNSCSFQKRAKLLKKMALRDRNQTGNLVLSDEEKNPIRHGAAITYAF